MNRKVVQLLIRFYPHSWRERYGTELESLLEEGHGGLHTAINVAWSGLRERLFPTPGLNTDQYSFAVQFDTWCVRAPWAIFGLGPMILLFGAWLIAIFILWSGWQIFLPGTDSPFVRTSEFAEMIYFNIGRALYFGAPVLIGWGIGLVAVRRRYRLIWPAMGLVLIALLGGTAQIHAGHTAVPRGLAHIRMDFALGTPVHGIPHGLFRAAVILLLSALPLVLWRFHQRNALLS